MKTDSIRFRIVLWVGICLLVSGTTVIAYGALLTYRTAVQKDKKNLEYSAYHSVSYIQSELKSKMVNLHVLAETLRRTKDPLETVHLNRDQVDSLLISILNESQNFIGVYTCWLPNAFDNQDEAYKNETGFEKTGRFSHYWYRNKFGIVDVKPLMHNENEKSDENFLNYHTLKKELITRPYIQTIEGKDYLIISLIKQIIFNGIYYGVVGIDIDAKVLQSMLNNPVLQDRGGEISLLGTRGEIVAISSDQGSMKYYASKTAQEVGLQSGQFQKGEKFSIFSKDTLEFFTPFKITDSDSWWIKVSLPKKQLIAEAVNLTKNLIFVGIICILVFGIIVWFMSGYIIGPLEFLVNSAHKMAGGDYDYRIEKPYPKGEIGELTAAFNNMSSAIKQREEERNRAEYKIKASLAEKETLLQEIHHRVKNNMQVISSLLSLQASSSDDDRIKHALLESKSRVYAMSAVHETLHGSDNLSKINLLTFLSKITTSVFQAYSVVLGTVKLNNRIEDISININQASPLGLIVNELISNSLKYAFPDDRKGEINVTARLMNRKLELILADDGIGMPAEFDWRKSNSLGLKLVRTSVENQLDGTIDLDSRSGTRFTIKFNLDET